MPNNTLEETVKDFCKGLLSEPNHLEVLENLNDSELDFVVGNLRFIEQNAILGVLASEMGRDRYILGGFCPFVIAKVTVWPEALIRVAQEGEAFEEIGDAMTEDQVYGLAQHCASIEGYGPHFNAYDGSDQWLSVLGTCYHVFDNH